MRGLGHNFEGSEGEQGTALGDQTGATAVIPLVLARGRTEVRTFNSLFNNRYPNDAETLGAWKSVSRVRRTGGGGKERILPRQRRAGPPEPREGEGVGKHVVAGPRALLAPASSGGFRILPGKKFLRSRKDFFAITTFEKHSGRTPPGPAQPPPPGTTP